MAIVQIEAQNTPNALLEGVQFYITQIPEERIEVTLLFQVCALAYQDFLKEHTLPDGEVSTLTFRRVEEVLFKERFVKHAPLPAWKARALSVEEALPKMLKNLEKAALQHASDIFIRSAAQLEPLGEVTYVIKGVSLLGSRPTQEDQYFFHDHKECVIAGVFDGHAGCEASQEACSFFSEHGVKYVADHKGNVHAAFEKLFEDAQAHILKKVVKGGTTALVVFLDKELGRLYTATLGDSEAFICRNRKLVALSAVRNWKSAKDAQRAFQATHQGSYIDSSLESKKLRIQGINVARALGEQEIHTVYPHVISIKPKISVADLMKKDRVLLTSDGITDFLPACRIAACSDIRALAEEATRANFHAADNTTIVEITIQ